MYFSCVYKIAIYLLVSGIGSALYKSLLKDLETKGIHSAIGIIPTNNRVSIEFHRIMGFAVVAHIKDAGFKFGKWLDTTYMQKMITDRRPPKNRI